LTQLAGLKAQHVREARFTSTGDPNAMSSRPLTALLLLTCASASASAATLNVNTVAELQSALANARAGDEIVLAAGATFQYTNGAIETAYFYSGANGTSTQPITLRSASSTNLAKIRGNDVTSKILLRIEGDYWVVKDLEFTNGQKGIVFDNSNYSKAINVVVHDVGMEAIHVRDGSDHVLIDNAWIYNTGLFNPQFGEGVYIGSDRSVWGTYDSSVDYTVVRNSNLGPNIKAEAFDIKEGTTETTIEKNTIYGTGISAAAFEDSFIDLKGVRTYVRFNTFNQGNEPKIKRGIAVIDRDRPLSSYEHVIHDNVFNMDDTTTPVLEEYSGTRDVYAYDNTRNPAGALYSSGVIQSKPSWYSGPGGGGTTNQPPTVSIASVTSQGPLTAGVPITIAANASDSDGRVSDVAFFRGSTLIGRDSTAPYSVIWSNPVAGNYSITAIATDDKGATRTSSAVPITVATAGGGGGNSSLVAQYQRGDTNAVDNRIRAHLRVKNTGTGTVSYSDLKLRYWFTMEGTGTPVFNIDYAAIGTNNVSGRFVNTGGADYYVEISFAGAAGSLAAGGDSGPIKIRITTSTNANQTESNDYSFGPDITTYQDYQKVGIYRSGSRVWGTEP
jgi:Cellulose binding domain/Bacterial Ig domain/Right handed beta helix region